jgi:hypothetical protein
VKAKGVGSPPNDPDHRVADQAEPWAEAGMARSRYEVLTRRLTNTLDGSLRLEMLEEALDRGDAGGGNMDQGVCSSRPKRGRASWSRRG